MSPSASNLAVSTKNAKERAERHALGGVSPVRHKPATRDLETVVQPTGPTPAAAAFPGFSYHGGPVVSFPLVYASFWGSSWLAGAPNLERAGRLSQFLTDILASNYMNVLSQYGAGSGAGSACFLRSSFVTNIPNNNLSGTDLRNTIQNCINAGVLPEPNGNVCLVIYLGDEVAINDPQDGIEMCEPTNDNAFGFHTFFTTTAGNPCYFAVIPGLTNACLTNSCPGNDLGCSLHLAETQEQRQTQVTSHEFAEMITDPELNAWWDSNTGAEIGDICNGESATITVGPNTWTVQREYSKTDDQQSNGATFCLVESPQPIPKITAGPGHSLTLVKRVHQLHSLAQFLPLPPVYFDAQKKKASTEEKDLHAFVHNMFRPLHHSDFMPDAPAFLRQFADVLEKTPKKR
jgi:hypothetical protein